MRAWFGLSEHYIHLLFDISLWAKGLFALIEVAAGALALFVSPDVVLSVATALTADELAGDPHDAVANFLLHSAQNFSVSAEHFAALYLLSHGIIKGVLIIGLLREKLSFYPAALVIFAAFIGYQLYRYMFTHSVWLLLLTALDLVVIALTWHEWRYLHRRLAGV